MVLPRMIGHVYSSASTTLGPQKAASEPGASSDDLRANATRPAISARWSGHPGSHEDQRRTSHSSFYRTSPRSSFLFPKEHCAATLGGSSGETGGLRRARDGDDGAEPSHTQKIQISFTNINYVLGTPTVSTTRHLRLLACGLPVFVMAYYQPPMWQPRRECALR